MSEQEILEGIKKYFDIQELVGSRTYQRYGERAWRFFDFRFLETLYIVRTEIIKKPIYANSWNYLASHGRSFEQRGLRTNIQPLVKDKTDRNKLYISAHILGKAIDFDVPGMTAEQVRQLIVKNADKLPYKIRLEDGVTWVHLDTIYEEHNPKVHLFLP